LWLGTHPGAPAQVERQGRRVSLAEVVSADPAGWLGGPVVDRFGPRLPFLLKVLAAEAPLSLQAHPDAARARAGYAAQAGLAEGDRNYVDPHHKPELLVALTPFEALCGFRDPKVSAEALAGFGVPALEPVIAALDEGADGLREAVRTLLTWPAGERTELVAAVAAARPSGPVEELARGLARRYPGDPGVLVALLLNHVRLEPGEAIWMPAGNLHAYLQGCGVEIMAASDNVLRGGLTPKRVDVPELLEVLCFEVLDRPVLPPRPVAPGVVTWPVPVPDFALHRVTVAGSAAVVLPVTGPRVLLCTAGELRVDDGAGPVDLPCGRAAVGAAASAGPLRVTGTGEGYLATVGSSGAPGGSSRP
jgi:mannose-6-phosphate isomerase